MALNDGRFKYISKIVATQLSSSTTSVSSAMIDKGANATFVGEFLGACESSAAEPRMALLFYLQPAAGSSEPVVMMTDGSDMPLTGRCCYAVPARRHGRPRQRADRKVEGLAEAN